MVKNYPVLKNLAALFFLLFAFSAFSQTSQTFITSGTFTAPCDVTSITVEVWGGGGKGGTRTNNGESGGGGGGAYVRSTFTVTSGSSYIVYVGAGSSTEAAGEDSWFINNTTILAKGGISVANNTIAGAAGGSVAASIGTVKYAGGNGANSSNNNYGGGGGSSAGNASNGTTATNQNGAIAPTGGGNGGNGATGNNENGLPGLNPGGGGGGARNTGGSQIGGSGANGLIKITYTSSYCAPTYTTRVDPITNVTFAGINNTTTNVTGGANLESFCLTGTVLQGSATNTISLKGNTVGLNTDYLTVFIDWNQDGDFLDAGETYNIGTIYNSTGLDAITANGNITVPATATLGNTRMRVFKRFAAYTTDPCQTTEYGQAEDYNIIVTAPSTITTGTISPTSYCAGATVSVPYTITGTYNAGNVFTAQLSDAVGSFAAPVNIGTLTSTVAGSISGTIPIGTATGTGYRIRVVSSNPAVTGSINGSNITINAIPATPTVGTITQPTCSLATGSVVLNGLPASGTWTLTRSPGAITSTGTGTSTTISGLATGTYNFTVTNASGCTSYASANVVINSQPSINTWSGSISTDWNISANWSCGTVPTISTDVLIPSAPASSNFPTIAAGGFGGLARDIEIQNGASITIEGVINILTGTGTGNALTIAGDLTLNGTIDLNGESQLLQDMGSVLDPLSTGTIEIDQQGEGNKYRYNYWSMPVYTDTDLIMGKHTTVFASLRDGTIPSSPALITFSNIGYDGAQTTPITLSTYWMFKYANSGSGYSAWDQVRSTGKVYTGQGFTMKGPKNPVLPITPAQNYVFVGKPNNGTIELTVAKDYDYLVGNPYPSALDADQFLIDNNPFGTASITGTIYFWEHYGGDTHNLEGYQGGYATYSLGSGVPASSFPGLGGGTSVKGAPGPYIPVGQAFFVVGDAVDGGQIQFNNGQRVFVKEGLTSIFMKSSDPKLKTENTRGADLRPKFRIGFDAPKISHRQLLFTIDERATQAVDWGFDAEIYEIFADDMYWMLNNKKYVIQATNNVGLNSEVPLGIQLSKTGMVTVKIDALENVDDDTSIYLKDKLTGESFNMRNKPVQLNLMAGKYTDRFALTFKTQKLVAEDVKAEVLIPASSQPIIEGIHVFMNNAIGELQIKNNSSEEITSVALVNTLGQTIKTWNSNFNIRTISLPLSTATGFYLVQITTKTSKTVKKISVQ
ncbi:MAG: GEVED domain-containing protein [Lutibacter sp.]|nr:GEVED domain-containing protein [Lutibacter sp.]